VRGDFPGSGELGEQGLSPGQQRDCRAACKTIRLEPGAKIRILKENRSFFPGWWGKGRFTAFSCHNQAQSLGSQTEYWIFFFFPLRKQIQYFLILLRCSCRVGEPAPLGAGSRVPSSAREGRSAKNQGQTRGLPTRRKVRDGGGKQRQGPGACFPPLGASYPALGMAPCVSRIPPASPGCRGTRNP